MDQVCLSTQASRHLRLRPPSDPGGSAPSSSDHPVLLSPEQEVHSQRSREARPQQTLTPCQHLGGFWTNGSWPERLTVQAKSGFLLSLFPNTERPAGSRGQSCAVFDSRATHPPPVGASRHTAPSVSYRLCSRHRACTGCPLFTDMTLDPNEDGPRTLLL